MDATAAIAASGITPEEIQKQLSHWHQDRGYVVVVVTTVFTALAVIATVLRLATRKFVVKIPWQKDDMAISIATILVIGLYVEAILSVHYGAGRHVVRVGVNGTVKVLQLTFALQLTYNTVHFFIKASLLFLYRSLLTLNNPRFRLSWYVTGTYVVILTVASQFATIFQCYPLGYGWTRIMVVDAKGHCVNLKAEAISMAAFGTLADFALLILPIPTLWALQLPKQQKLALVFIFLLGGFACIAAIIRIVFLSRVTSSVDFTYIEIDSLNWSLIEPCVGIVCACLPTLRPLLRKIPFLDLRSALGKGSGGGSGSGSGHSGQGGNKKIGGRSTTPKVENEAEETRSTGGLISLDVDLELAQYDGPRSTHQMEFGQHVDSRYQRGGLGDQGPPEIAEQRLTDPRLLNVVRYSEDSGSQYSEVGRSASDLNMERCDRFSHAM